jgi:UDP-3-O-[3-hydroxymyristoyl] glucosamine N-acyltransferase
VYSLKELASVLGAEWKGNGEARISGLSTLAQAQNGQLSFLANAKYQKHLELTQASAVIITEELSHLAPCNCLIHENPYLTFARATQLFNNAPRDVAGIHRSAVISESASVSALASIGAHAVISDRAVIEDHVVIGAGCIVGEGSRVGVSSRLHANVTLYHDVKIGEHCVIHSGAVIGADGFGFAPSDQGWQKIYQLGGVTVENRVEIGAGTTIDRGALLDTHIGEGVIIDNQVQIAHNVVIGENTAIAGCTAIAGSTEIGKNCTIAGAVGIVGHLTIADNVHVTAMSLVTGSIKEAGAYSSGTPMLKTAKWRRNAVRYGQLDSLAKRVSIIEKNSVSS